MTASERFTALAGGPSGEEREARLAAGADELANRRRRRSPLAGPRLLLTISASLVTSGLCLILLGWLGAARSTVVEEQVPYLISGGLLGLALATVGAVTFFAHWLTVLMGEARAREVARRQDHAELVGVIRALMEKIDDQETANGRAGGIRAQRPVRRAPRSS